MPAFITVLLWLFGIFILYLVIKAAINGSDLAYDVRAIRKILEKQYSIEIIENEETDMENLSPGQTTDSAGTPVNLTCPACGADLEASDKTCPECGLTLR